MGIKYLDETEKVAPTSKIKYLDGGESPASENTFQSAIESLSGILNRTTRTTPAEKLGTAAIAGLPSMAAGRRPAEAWSGVKWSLPIVGQTVGGIFGGFPGAVAGAGAGEALKQGFDTLEGQPFDVAEIGKDVGMTALLEGIFRGGGKMLKPVAGRLMNSALRPAIKQMSKGKNLGSEAVEEGLTGTEKGIFKKASKLVEDSEDELQKVLSGSSQKINLPKVLSKLDSLEAEYASIGDQAGLSAIRNLKEGLSSNLKFGSFGEIPVSKANELKRALYNSLRESNYGTSEVGSAVAAKKVVARALKESIENAEPRVADLNRKIGVGARTRDAIEKRMAQSEKNNMLGLSDLILGSGGYAGGGPGAAIALPIIKRLLGTSVAKSNLAGLLNNLSGQEGLGAVARISTSELARG